MMPSALAISASVCLISSLSSGGNDFGKMDTLIAELDLPKTKLSEAEQAQLNTQ